jgi:hypothetical protein
MTDRKSSKRKTKTIEIKALTSEDLKTKVKATVAKAEEANWKLVKHKQSSRNSFTLEFEPVSKAKSSTMRTIAIGLVIGIIILVIFFVGIAALGQFTLVNEPPTQIVLVPTATNSPLPSDTPLPSNTPLPSDTPLPTATFTETMIPTATFTPRSFPTVTITPTPIPTSTASIELNIRRLEADLEDYSYSEIISVAILNERPSGGASEITINYRLQTSGGFKLEGDWVDILFVVGFTTEYYDLDVDNLRIVEFNQENEITGEVRSGVGALVKFLAYRDGNGDSFFSQLEIDGFDGIYDDMTTSSISTPARTMYADGVVRVRDCPFTDCEVMLQLQDGEEVVVVGTADGDSYQGSTLWYELSTGYYVHSELLSIYQN